MLDQYSIFIWRIFLIAHVLFYAVAVQPEEWAMLSQINALRAEGYTCGDGTVHAPNSKQMEMDCRLYGAALFHSQDMAKRNFFDHNDPEGNSFRDRCDDQDIIASGENIAAGPESISATIDLWKGSIGHCNAMMNQHYKFIGIGRAYNADSDYGYYWTNVFAADTILWDAPVRKGCYSDDGQTTTLEAETTVGAETTVEAQTTLEAETTVDANDDLCNSNDDCVTMNTFCNDDSQDGFLGFCEVCSSNQDDLWGLVATRYSERCEHNDSGDYSDTYGSYGSDYSDGGDFSDADNYSDGGYSDGGDFSDAGDYYGDYSDGGEFSDGSDADTSASGYSAKANTRVDDDDELDNATFSYGLVFMALTYLVAFV